MHPPKSEVKKTDLSTLGEATVANSYVAVADKSNEEIGSDVFDEVSAEILEIITTPQIGEQTAVSNDDLGPGVTTSEDIPG